MVVSKKNKSRVQLKKGQVHVKVPQQFFTTAVRSTRVVPSL